MKQITDLKEKAEQGDPTAQYNLGLAYARGDVVPKDFKQAVHWFRKATKQGQAKAQSKLGFAYAHGHGVPSNPKQAAHWNRKAAEQGHPEAQYQLGIDYWYGQGVPKDRTEAYVWLILFKPTDDEKGEYLRKHARKYYNYIDLRKELTSAQIKKAEERALALQAKIQANQPPN